MKEPPRPRAYKRPTLSLDAMEHVAPISLEEARKRLPPIWTIYDNPRDYAGSIVIRKWWGEVPEPAVMIAVSIEAARGIAQCEGASICLGRDADDDPCIVESWI